MAAQVITFQCVVKNRCGTLISNTTNCNVLSDGRQRPSLLPALAEALQDLREGERRTICLLASDAYGFYDPQLVFTRLRDELVMGDSIRRGEQIRYSHQGKLKLCKVIAADDFSVTFDANHPLAGQDLIFEIYTIRARIASSDEIKSDDISRELLH